MIDKKRVKKILFIKTSALGDVVRSLPALVSVARMFPNASISFLVAKEYAGLIERCPYVDEVILYKKRKNMQDILGFIRFLFEMKAKRFDMVLNLQNTKRFDLVARISGAPLCTSVIELDRPVDGVEGVFEVLKTVGLQPKRRHFEFWFSDEDHEFVKQFYEDNGLEPDECIVGICPGGEWQSKQWPLYHYADLADLIRDTYGARVVVFGTSAERERAERIASFAGTEVLIASGDTTIRQAACLINKCRVFISNDSGLMHLAAHLDVPTIGVFGSTNPAYHGPAREGNVSVFRGVDCSPCYSPICNLEYEQYFCLKAITPRHVFKVVRKIMR